MFKEKLYEITEKYFLSDYIDLNRYIKLSEKIDKLNEDAALDLIIKMNLLKEVEAEVLNKNSKIQPNLKSANPQMTKALVPVAAKPIPVAKKVINPRLLKYGKVAGVAGAVIGGAAIAKHLINKKKQKEEIKNEEKDLSTFEKLKTSGPAAPIFSKERQWLHSCVYNCRKGSIKKQFNVGNDVKKCIIACNQKFLAAKKRKLK